MARNIYEDILSGRYNEDPPVDSISQEEAYREQTVTGNPVITAQRPVARPQIKGGVAVPSQVVPSDAPNKFFNAIGKSPSYVAAGVQPSRTRPSWADVWRHLTPQETEEERQARNRKEQRRLIWNTVGDGIAAIANLAGTSSGAPSIGTPQLTARQQARLDAELAERKRNRENYINNYIRSMQTDYANNLAEQREDRLREQHDLNLRRQEWRELQEQNKYDYNREKLRIEEEYKKGLITLREKELRLRELSTYDRLYGTTVTKTYSPKGVTTSYKTRTQHKYFNETPSGNNTSGGDGQSVSTGVTDSSSRATVMPGKRNDGRAANGRVRQYRQKKARNTPQTTIARSAQNGAQQTTTGKKPLNVIWIK